MYQDLFFPSHRCLTPTSWGTPCDINAIYKQLKSKFSGLQFHRWHYGFIFIRLVAVGSQNREITRNSAKIWPYNSSRSSKVIDLGVNGKPICDRLPISHSLAICATVFEIFTLKHRKLLILPMHPPLFDAPLGGNPLEFRNETYPAKTRGMWLSYGENFIIITSTVFLWYTRVTDERTDRQTYRRTGDGIRAIALSRVKTRLRRGKIETQFQACLTRKKPKSKNQFSHFRMNFRMNF